MFCLACADDECFTCTFCLKNKLTKVHRVPIEKAATLILQTLGKDLTPLRLARLLAKYARSDEFAAEINESFQSHGLSKAELCGHHEHQFEAFAVERAELLAKIRRGDQQLAAERDRRLRETKGLEGRLAKLEHELEDDELDDARRELALRMRARENLQLQKELDGGARRRAARGPARREGRHRRQARATSPTRRASARQRALADALARAQELENELRTKQLALRECSASAPSTRTVASDGSAPSPS